MSDLFAGALFLLVAVGGLSLGLFFFHTIVNIGILIVQLIYATLKFSALPNHKDRRKARNDWMHYHTRKY